MTGASLLVELLTEELPPKALARLGDAFASGLAAGLESRRFLSASSVVTGFATPRRLAVLITAVAGRSPDRPVRTKLLPVSVAFDAAGKPTRALLGKLDSLGLSGRDPAGFERASDGKVEALYHSDVEAGLDLAAGLQPALDEALAKLPIPKVMRYQRDGAAWNDAPIEFVRPAHGLVALHGTQVVPVRALGLQASNSTRGHRFMSDGPIAIETADAYEATLRDKGKVIASYGKRREAMCAALLAKAGTDSIIMPQALVDEVCSLVEWPVVYEATFDRAFLDVPQECLILTMQQNQKYFALTGAGGRMLNRFLLVSNLQTDDPGAIVGGNERVLRARLSDARFFFQQDKKRSLESRLPGLESVVYHARLGTQAQRNTRVTLLADEVARLLGMNVGRAERAARLSKADLLTDMVGEFPELQGLMGRYYALNDGEDAEVAQAIEEHYRPRFAGDALPATEAGLCVAMADKLETLAGLFGIGQQPTGDRDPFALRRHALGVLRMLIEVPLPLRFEPLVALAFASFAQVPGVAAKHQELTEFVYDRLRGYLRDRGYSANEIEAVLSVRPEILSTIPQRLDAVRSFSALPEAASLAAANKRIDNILKKAGGAAGRIDESLLREPAERALAAAHREIGESALRHFDAGHYEKALGALAALRAPVDAFFTDVMVMAEDPALRANRIALLRELHGAMNRVADLSKLAA